MMNYPLYTMHNLSNQNQILVLVEFLGSVYASNLAGWRCPSKPMQLTQQSDIQKLSIKLTLFLYHVR